MNLGPLIVLLKLFEESGIVSPSKTVTPPSSKAGLRPACAAGEKSIYDPMADKYICVKKFD